MRDDGEPISHGQLDRESADGLVLRKTLVTVALLAAVVLANGLLVILGIELLEGLGMWPTPEPQTTAP